MISVRSFNPAYRFRRFMSWSRKAYPGWIESIADTVVPESIVAPALRRALSTGTADEDIGTQTSKRERGARFQRDRLAAVAAWCAEKNPGDIVEIGAFVGLTTIRLAEIARRFGRRVMVVDPWLPGTQNCDGGEYEAFQANTAAFKDIIDVVRESSLSPAAEGILGGREFCFALVDGLHTYDACLSDIMAVSHCRGAIGVDDLGVMVARSGEGGGMMELSREGGGRYDETLRTAFRRAARLTGRTAVHHPHSREGYLLRS